MQSLFVDKLARAHEIDENALEGGIRLEGLDAQRSEVEDVVLQGPDHAVDVAVEHDAVVLHEDILLFGAQLEIAALARTLRLESLPGAGTRSVLGT